MLPVRRTRNLIASLAAVLSTAAGEASSSPLLSRLATVPVDGAEIVAYDPATNCAFVTSGAKVVTVHLGAGDDPVVVRESDLRDLVPGAGEVSHVAVDPAGRGFLAVTVLPILRAHEPGRVVFLSTRTGRPLGSVPVGHNPDACAFDAEGARLVVANEGEPATIGGVVIDPPGSVSVVRLDRVRDARGLAALDAASVVTLYPAFSAPPTGVRIHPRNAASPSLDLEPESIAILGDEAFVTCQENDAILRVDLRVPAITALAGLGRVERTVDARADGSIEIDDVRPALAMPDQIAAFRHRDGRAFLLTADEGDARGVIGKDRTPLADVRRPAKREALVCGFSPAPAPLTGARSVSVLDAATLVRVADTGDRFERETAARMPAWFNADVVGAKVEPDARSRSRGPEPEGLAVGVVAGRRYAFCTLERPGAIAVLDLEEPTAPTLVELLPTAPDGDLGPEGVCFVRPDDTPTGAAWLIVGFEGSGTVAVLRVGTTLLR